MTTRAKICGIKTLEDAMVAVEAGADALGFVFAEEAKARNRYIEPEAAQRIVEQLPPWVMTVGVVVNEPVDDIRQWLQFLDRVQVHGEAAAGVARELGHAIIPAFRVGPGFSILDAHLNCFAGCLLDAYVPGAHGGTGTTFDWSIARAAVDAGATVILAGGLTPENVAQAIAQVRPYAVDTSGGVERAPGIKDHDRIRAFLHNAKTPVS